jgi:sterol desaturase/sphingolipid hydroxylase (fatty acid hydroxylase superfamily)
LTVALSDSQGVFIMPLPSLTLAATTLIFLAWERYFPGRDLPAIRGWIPRALALNATQAAISMLTLTLWFDLLGSTSVFALRNWDSPVLQGLVAWLVGSFFFYWWHRARHLKGLWHVLHQIHHSPSRIELLTAFYKHPLEIFADTLLAAVVTYSLLGCSLEGAMWFNVFAATGEYCYHGNVRTPRWLRYFVQTPELHSLHHALDVHKYNFSDLPIWDRLFGTYKDSATFATRCGFPNDAEQRLGSMLLFRDEYR